MLKETLERIGTDYAIAKSSPFKGNALAEFIRQDACDAVRAALGTYGMDLLVEGSPGKGQWAHVPWLAVFDPLITDSATHGYYVVYLFHATQPVVHLSLNQGATAVEEEFGADHRRVLQERAALIQSRVPEFISDQTTASIDLGSTATLPRGYVAGHALGYTYSIAALPDEAVLRGHLNEIVRAYRALIFRGGLDEAPSTTIEEENFNHKATLEEKRQYRFHKRIERNPTASKEAKKHHGTRCQACRLDFAERYGPLGQGFIEAHHLTPIGSLKEGLVVTYNIAKDFAVLCSNCHRMIHRTANPADLDALRAMLTAPL